MMNVADKQKKKKIIYSGLEVLITVSVKIQVLWGVTPCRWTFRKIVVPKFKSERSLKISEIICPTTRRHTAEDFNLHFHKNISPYCLFNIAVSSSVWVASNSRTGE